MQIFFMLVFNYSLDSPSKKYGENFSKVILKIPPKKLEAISLLLVELK